MVDSCEGGGVTYTSVASDWSEGFLSNVNLNNNNNNNEAREGEAGGASVAFPSEASTEGGVVGREGAELLSQINPSPVH